MQTQLPALLVITGQDGVGQVTPLSKARMTIGRDPTNDMVIIDPAASRIHAAVSQRKKDYYVQDLKSTNGTMVNGRKLSGNHKLQEGDHIQIGAIHVRYFQAGGDSTRYSELLPLLPIFQKTQQVARAKVLKQGKFRYYTPETSMDLPPDQALFVILFGAVAATFAAKNKRKPMHFGSGQFFEAAGPGTGTGIKAVTFMEPTCLLVIPRTTVDELIVPFFRDLPFFHDLKDAELNAVGSRMNLECYPVDTTLFRQGQPADALYILIYGAVSMIKSGDEVEQSRGDEIRSYSRGELFGELGLLVDQPRAATARISKQAGLLVLLKKEFEEVKEQYPNIVVCFYRYLAGLLEQQSDAYWRAARDVEKMKDLIQSTKMAALGQLVAGVAHEINTPVGSIHSNSGQLKDILSEIQKNYESLPQLIARFYSEERVAETAVQLGLALDPETLKVVTLLSQAQRAYLEQYNTDKDMAFLFSDALDIADELGEASRRITTMVKSLANFARLGEADHKKVDIHEGLDSSLALLHHELKYKVVVEKKYSQLPEITCYPNQLNQVFMNILMNAIQAMELEKLPEDKKGRIMIETYREGDTAVIAISDTGKGIEPDKQDKIFEPFYTTKEAGAAAGGLGLGLGLSISQKIVTERHNGTLTVKSTPGQSTTFYIRLPIDTNSTLTQTLFFSQTDSEDDFKAK